MTNPKLKIAIIGAAGRMGRNLIQSCLQNTSLELVAAVDKNLLEIDAGQLIGRPNCNVKITSDMDNAIRICDCVVEFTSVATSLQLVELCICHNKNLVSGTTGFSEQQKQNFEKAGSKIRVLHAPNMSVGINLTYKLLKLAAKALDHYDIEIIEAHHRDKVDAPSGTALKMGEVIAKEKGLDLASKGVFTRHGIEAKRKAQDIGFATIRGGDIIGEHTAMFAGQGERIEITHKSSSRITYANGAMRAALWLANQPNGLYSMDDVLELKS